jgi:S-adenosylhomocysteine hydrolase
MITLLKLIVSDEITYNLELILELTNNLQLFFRVEQENHKIQIPDAQPDGMPNRPEIFTSYLEEFGDILNQYPRINYVIITDKLIWGDPEQGLHFISDHLSIISNYYCEIKNENANIVRLISYIIQSGMRSFLNNECEDPGCICGNKKDFISLCENCENKIRKLGYHDAISHLKDSINWLNQRWGMINPNLIYRNRFQQIAHLELAQKYANQIIKEGNKPFANKSILMVLHFLSDLVPFVKSLEILGCNYKDMILVAKPYPYPKRDYISHELQLLGVNVHRASNQKSVEECVKEVLNQLKNDSSRSKKKLLIIEDGGYFGPLLHDSKYSELLGRCIGIVEQTTKGARRDEEIIQPKVPIISVATSRFKNNYESPEIGRVTVQNIGRFVPNIKLSGKYAAIFGFGSIGEHVANQLNKAFNMGVSIVEIDDIKLMYAQHRKDIILEAKSSFSSLRFQKEVSLVIGTTGRKSITKEILSKLPDGCILVSTSSDQIEIEIDALEKMSNKIYKIEEGVTEYIIGKGRKRKKIILLAEGYPINFYGSDSLPNDTIDPIMTLLILGAVEICNNRDSYKNCVDNESVDFIVKKYNLVNNIIQ